jgi:signal transduction histidine kinase/Tfp pilus assembly protein PilF
MKNKKTADDSGDLAKLEVQYRANLRSKNKKLRLDSLTGLGTLYFEEKQFAESEKHLLAALDIAENKTGNSKLSLIYRTLGMVTLKLFKLKEAEDYLTKALEITPVTNRRIISLIYDSLGDAFTRMSENEKGLGYYSKALKIRKDMSLYTGVSETLNKIGVNYYFSGDYENALKYVGESLEMREERNEKKEAVASCLNNLCLAHYQKGELKEALTYGLRSLKIFEETNVVENQGMVYNNLGLVYFEMSLFSEALECQFKALEIKEKFANKAVIANTLSNIGIIFTRLFNLEKAIEYSNRALEYRKTAVDRRGIANSYNDIGRIYDKMNDFEKAISFLEDSIKIRKETGSLFGMAASLENLGMIFFKQGKYDESEKHLLEAKRINEKLGEKKAISGINRNISSLYLAQGKFEEALVYIKRSHDLAKELNMSDKLRDAYKILAEIYTRKNNYKSAFGYFVKYSKLNEDILNLKKQHEIHNITTKYENYKKDKESEIFKIKNIELAKVNKELKKSKSELMKSNFSKDKFFNIIAHDLKNPFSILYTTSELLFEYFDDLSVKKQKEYINTINLSAKHVLKLIENLLEWSRSQSGLKQFDPQMFNFSDSLNSCLDLLRYNAKTKDIVITADVEPDIFIYADKNMIKTVVRNFVTNSIKFTGKGGRISIRAEKTDSSFSFFVKDNGVGIKKKDISKLFVIDKHFVTNGTENEKGTGLGLLLCREFIEKHNGNVFVESVSKKGSTFGFTIPLKNP